MEYYKPEEFDIDQFKKNCYESPISIETKIAENITSQIEDGVMSAIMDINITVNKDELVKALEYDRDQFDKGYECGFKCGKEAAWRELLPKLEELIKEVKENGKIH